MKSFIKILIIIIAAMSSYILPNKETYYDILGISQNATEQEIRKAYLGLSRKWHPDKNKSEQAEEMFKKISNAYETLSDPSKKQTYDWVLKSKQRTEAGQKEKEQKQEYAGGAEVVIEQSAKASKPSERFNFEIMNKANNPIFVTLENDNRILITNQEISGSKGSVATRGYLRLSGINTEKPTTLQVKHAGLPTPQPKKYQINTNRGDTVFLTWDKDNFPRPQTGPWFGILGKTESELSLSNNVGKNQIKQIK